jgi:ubiquinone/menaquinone biosynthesis C-methylase UbiE
MLKVSQGKGTNMGRTEDQMSDAAEAPTKELFLKMWKVYRKMVDNDYLFHRGAYSCLRRILLEEIDRPFQFLDVACGDASMSVGALKATQVTHYHGLDISQQALDIAADFLKELDCPCSLERRDFVTALRSWNRPADVVWIGLSLHHLLAPAKLEVMRDIRRIAGETGRLLIYEDASPDGESRETWLRRWDDQKPLWTAYTEAEWTDLTAHVHSSDFPETDARWRELGIEAGFSRVREMFASPTGLFRLYSFET